MVRHKSFAEMQCPIARSLEETGDWWSMLILRTAFTGARRFQDFQSRLGIAPNTLSRRLEGLLEHGLLERRTYSEHPPREEYWLTEKGSDFLPVLLALSAWGNRWLSPEGATLECVDPGTGRVVSPMVVDRETGRELRAGEVAIRPGPGADSSLKQAIETFIVMGEKRASNGQS